MAENSYRIHTNIGSDKVLNVKMRQDMDFLEVLTLKLSQEDTYKTDNSNYGVIIGRVNANDAFGIPNAKISAFIPIDGNENNTDILNIYRYANVTDINKDNIRYNLLPDDSDNECYRTVGTFPNKRLMLDDSTVLEVFDTYYKYTTVSNNAGDYMIYGLPTGSTQLHVDIDLSDIGVLSQKPRDFIYKGYNETQFDNASQFKESTNLDTLSQIITQNQSVYIYPFFGDESAEDIAITRCDIQVQYKFEPTCVFFGAMVSDGGTTSISHNCSPDNKSGRNSELVAGSGTIEMIRKTLDGLTEEYQIQGNQLIDNDGVWCYQIPMNLDYVGTDEYGNIVATDDPSKGIPTRTRVRFRFTITDTDNENFSLYRAKYLVPNNPKIVSNSHIPLIENCAGFEKHFEFGSSTLDEDYRDLYWNKVYSVKNYIPRLQTSWRINTKQHTGLRTANDSQGKNPVPYNKVTFHLPFLYKLVCIFVKIIVGIVAFVNAISSVINGIWSFITWGFGDNLIDCISYGGSFTESSESNKAYYPGCSEGSMNDSKCPEGMEGCKKENKTDELYDVIEESLAQEFDVIHLDFFNDWLNGTLYFPLWHWKRTRKRSFFFGLFTKRAKSIYCECDTRKNLLRLMDNCALSYKGPTNDNGDKWHNVHRMDKTKWGIVKNVQNKDGLNLYYYAPGVIADNKPYENSEDALGKAFMRYFATDIILLGSFNDCDLDGIPKLYENLPSTTANIVSLTKIVENLNNEDDEDEDTIEGTSQDNGTIESTGMDWLHDAGRTTPKYVNGLFFGLDCTEVYTKPKTCVNASRISELGVSNDVGYIDTYAESPGALRQTQIIADGLIGRIEIDDPESRAMFATLNQNGLDDLRYDERTGYKVYNLRYLYPTDFDGRNRPTVLSSYRIKDRDVEDMEYRKFKYGNDWKPKGGYIHNYTTSSPYSYKSSDYFPLYNNSFYFYFGATEGKTAIDKLRTKFVSKCFRNQKYPFDIDINKRASAWCPYQEGELVPEMCGVIDITLKDIRKPYSYTLSYLSTGDKILTENNMTKDRLMFGILYENGKYAEGNTYIDEKNKGYQKDGYFHKLAGKGGADEIATYVNELGETVPYTVDNGLYAIEVTDSNGDKQKFRISLVQDPISIEYEAVDLGTKFFPKENEGDDESLWTNSSVVYENGNYGEIYIKSILLDGEEYKITGSTCEGGNKCEVGNKYTLKISNDKYQYDVRLIIRVREFNFPTDVRESISVEQGGWQSDVWFNETTPISGVDFNTITNGENNFDYSGEAPSTGITLTAHTWIPGAYEFIVTQLCDSDPEISGGTLNDNSSSVLININNGQLFDAIINEVPIRFINDTDPLVKAERSGNLPLNVQDTSLWICGMGETQTINSIGGYNFPQPWSNEALWSEYIDYDPYYTESEFDEEGNAISVKKGCTNMTKVRALMYELESMFKLTNAAFFTDNGKNSFEFKVKGGKKPIIRKFTPEYSEFEALPETDKEEGIALGWTYDDANKITCDSWHPNIISSSYKFYCQNFDTPAYRSIPRDARLLPLTTFKSPLYNDAEKYKLNGDAHFNVLIDENVATAKKDTGYNVNYFAAFNKEGKGNLVLNEDGKYMYDKKYERVPSYAQQMKSTIKFFTNDAEEKPSEHKDILKTWFKTEFVDKRLSYRISMINASSAVDDFKGAIYAKLNGGIAMKYDPITHNILSKDAQDEESHLEYNYTFDDQNGDGEITLTHIGNTNDLSRKYHTATMTINGKKVDLQNDNPVMQFQEGDENEYQITRKICDSNSYGETFKRIKDKEYAINGRIKVQFIDCSYDIMPNIQYIKENEVVEELEEGEDIMMSNSNIICTTEEGMDASFTINVGNFYEFKNASLSNCMENGNFNLIYESSNGTDYSVTLGRLAVTIKNDRTNNNELLCTPYRPFLKQFNSKSEITEFLEYVHNLTDEEDENEYDSKLFLPYKWLREKYNKDNSIKLHPYGNETVQENLMDYSDSPSNRDYQFLWHEHGHHALSFGTDDNILTNLSMYAKGNKLIYSSFFGQKGIWGYDGADMYGSGRLALALGLEGVEYLALIGGRQYADISQKCIEREIRLLDINNIYDLRPISINQGSVSTSTDPETNEYKITINGFKVNGSVKDSNFDLSKDIRTEEDSDFVDDNVNIDDKVGVVLWVDDEKINTSYSATSINPSEENPNEVKIEIAVDAEDAEEIKGSEATLQLFLTNKQRLVCGLSFNINI